jgi:hypothetical protein
MFYFVEVTRRYPRDMIGVRFFGSFAISDMTTISCTTGDNPSYKSPFRAFMGRANSWNHVISEQQHLELDRRMVLNDHDDKY